MPPASPPPPAGQETASGILDPPALLHTPSTPLGTPRAPTWLEPPAPGDGSWAHEASTDEGANMRGGTPIMVDSTSRHSGGAQKEDQERTWSTQPAGREGGRGSGEGNARDGQDIERRGRDLVRIHTGTDALEPSRPPVRASPGPQLQAIDDWIDWETTPRGHDDHDEETTAQVGYGCDSGRTPSPSSKSKRSARTRACPTRAKACGARSC